MSDSYHASEELKDEIAEKVCEVVEENEKEEENEKKRESLIPTLSTSKRSEENESKTIHSL